MQLALEEIARDQKYMVEYRKNITVKIVKWLSSEEIKLAFH